MTTHTSLDGPSQALWEDGSQLPGTEPDSGAGGVEDFDLSSLEHAYLHAGFSRAQSCFHNSSPSRGPLMSFSWFWVVRRALVVDVGMYPRYCCRVFYNRCLHVTQHEDSMSEAPQPQLRLSPHHEVTHFTRFFFYLPPPVQTPPTLLLRPLPYPTPPRAPLTVEDLVEQELPASLSPSKPKVLPSAAGYPVLPAEGGLELRAAATSLEVTRPSHETSKIGADVPGRDGNVSGDGDDEPPSCRQTRPRLKSTAPSKTGTDLKETLRLGGTGQSDNDDVVEDEQRLAATMAAIAKESSVSGEGSRRYSDGFPICEEEESCTESESEATSATGRVKGEAGVASSVVEEARRLAISVEMARPAMTPEQIQEVHALLKQTLRGVGGE